MIATLEHPRHQRTISYHQWQRVGMLRLRFPQRATMSELSQQELFELASRIDEVCGRFEASWTTGDQPRIEVYLEQLPESDRPDLLRDLLANELELLANSGSHAVESSYGDRFPAYRDVVKGSSQIRRSTLSSANCGTTNCSRSSVKAEWGLSIRPCILD